MTIAEIISMCAGGLMTIITGVILFTIKSYLGDNKKYRLEREEKEKAKDTLVLGLARVTLLETYNKSMEKGYYSLDDREVYGKLFSSYIVNGGDGVIDQLIPKLRALPTNPPDKQESEIS